MHKTSLKNSLNSKYFQILIVASLASPNAVLAASEKVLSLSDAKATAIARSPRLGAARERITQAAMKIREIGSKYYPRLRFVSSATGYLATPVSDRNDSQGRTSDPYILFGNYLEATWTLFDGFKTRFEKQSAQFRMASEKALLLDEHRLLALAVSKAYLGGQMARENVRYHQEKLELQEQLVEALRLSNEESDSDFGEIDADNSQKVELERLRDGLVKAELEEELARIVLAELLNEKEGIVEATLEPVSKLSDEMVKQASKSFDSQVAAKAFSTRQDIQAEVSRLGAARAIVKVEGANALPRVILEGRAGYQSVNGYEFGSENQGAYVGARVEWDIFDGGEKRARKRAAEAAAAEVREMLNMKALEVRRDVYSSRAELRSSFEILKNRSAAEKVALADYETVNARFISGSATKAELLMAQQRLLTEQFNVRLAKISSLQSAEQCSAAAGNNFTQGSAFRRSPRG